jgi:hypothetical protein
MKSEFNPRPETMTRISLGTLLIFALIICNSLGHARQADGPKMVLVEKTYDAGDIKEKEVIEHSFKVLNIGDRDLVIKKVSPG